MQRSVVITPNMKAAVGNNQSFRRRKSINKIQKKKKQKKTKKKKLKNKKKNKKKTIILVLLKTDMPCRCKQCRSRLVGFFYTVNKNVKQAWHIENVMHLPLMLGS